MKEYGEANRFLNYGMKSVVREYAIIQLDNFIEVRRALLANFVAAGKKEIDQCLEPLWQPVLEHARVIKKMRNQHFAHVDGPDEVIIAKLLIEYNYPSGFGDTLFLVACAWCYCVEINENFRQEWQTAREKLKQLTPTNVPPERINESQVRAHLSKLQLEAATNLRAHNFKTRIDRDVQEIEKAK